MAAVVGSEASAVEQPGEDPRNLQRLCGYVYANLRETDPEAPNRYRHQTLMWELAGVGAQDSREIIREKMQLFWNGGGRALRCNSPGFVQGGGNLIKYAVHRRFNEFIDDVAIRWLVDLNGIDGSDGRTVLDYVESERSRFAGTPIHATLTMYYGKLQRAGAKRRQEIDGTDCTYWPDRSRISRECPPPPDRES